jgi:DNA polymerase I-like protein with 3'-5' exonuclease and polymerase domains
MIIKGDASQLEWRSFLELSQDQVGIEEIRQKFDIHTNNQQAFQLPSRLIAKVFLFRWIYRGTAYAYSMDNDFIPVSSSPAFWQDVIDKANRKYRGLYEFQERLIARAEAREVIQIPSGREYLFSLSQNKKGEFYWDHKQIVNYPNQGFAHDLMSIARVSFRRRLQKYPPDKYRLFNTVHDDIEIDVANDPELCYNICIELENVFTDIPKNFERFYKKPFRTPLAGEVSFGHNLQELTKFKRESGKDQFNAN